MRNVHLFPLPVERLRLLENKCSHFVYLFTTVQNSEVSIIHLFCITYNEGSHSCTEVQSEPR